MLTRPVYERMSIELQGRCGVCVWVTVRKTKWVQFFLENELTPDAHCTSFAAAIAATTVLLCRLVVTTTRAVHSSPRKRRARIGRATNAIAHSPTRRRRLTIPLGNDGEE